MMNIFSDKKFLWFIAKFLLLFCIFYFGTLAIIGLASPGKYYSSFIDHYFDYVSGIKNMLLYCSKKILQFFGVDARIEPGFIIRYYRGKGVFIAMSCVGYGVYSFWLAYVLANIIPVSKKILWGIGGLLLLFAINVVRITLYLTALNKGWPMPLGIDHHTWFNIAAYLAIFIMIWRFEKMTKKFLNDHGQSTTVGI
jgi:exosortase/archaeosortase family protein